MTDTKKNVHGRKRGRGIRPWLIQAKFVGLVGFLGGMASLGFMGLLGPTPETIEGWELVRGLSRAVFYPCLFCGLVLTVLAGIALWLQHPVVFWRMRWFKLKAALLVVFVPTSHLAARGQVMKFYEAIDTGRLEVLPGLWQNVTWAYLIALVIMLAIAIVGKVKPRLGQPYTWAKKKEQDARAESMEGEVGSGRAQADRPGRAAHAPGERNVVGSAAAVG